MTTDRIEIAARAMVILMSQHPNATRGWIAEMSLSMADVMMRRQLSAVESDASTKFADTPRIYAEDEPHT